MTAATGIDLLHRDFRHHITQPMRSRMQDPEASVVGSQMTALEKRGADDWYQLTVEYFLELLLKASHTLGGVDMVQYQIKQKFWSLGGKFKIMDNAGNLAYYVQGSFMKIPKQFTITKPDGAQVSRIKKVLFQILSVYDVYKVPFPQRYVNLFQ